MIDKLIKDTYHLQRLLHLAGYDCGPIDGIRGPQSNKALEHWLLDAAEYRSIYGNLDERSEKNLEELLPFLQKIVRIWFKEKVNDFMAKHGVKVKIICGTRTWKEQNDLYNKRPRVTSVKAGYSFHNFGIAFDIGIFSQSGKYYEDNEMYDKLYEECSAPEGFFWGGLWKKLHDSPHYQYNGFGSTSAKVRKKYLENG